MTQKPPIAQTHDDTTLGLRLRRAREARGLSQAAAAAALRLPLAIVEAMEREDLARLGAPIYVRGTFSSYARLVGVSTVVVDGFCRGLDLAPQPLTQANHAPRSRRVLDRYLKRAAYVALTASIVPSVIWLASLDRQPPAVQTLLEAPARPVQTVPEAANPPAPGESAAATPAPQETALQPIKAALTPSYASVPVAAPATTPDPAPALDVLVLRFVQESWFEVLDAAGRPIESGIAVAGSERSFAAAEVGKVSLGNAHGVQVERGGQVVDLAPFQRANIARFALSSGGSLVPVDG